VPKTGRNDRVKEIHKHQVKIKEIKVFQIEKRDVNKKYDKNGKQKENNEK